MWPLCGVPGSTLPHKQAPIFRVTRGLDPLKSRRATFKAPVHEGGLNETGCRARARWGRQEAFPGTLLRAFLAAAWRKQGTRAKAGPEGPVGLGLAIQLLSKTWEGSQEL